MGLGEAFSALGKHAMASGDKEAAGTHFGSSADAYRMCQIHKISRFLFSTPSRFWGDVPLRDLFIL